MVVHCSLLCKKGGDNFIVEFTGVTKIKISNKKNMNENMQKFSPKLNFMHAVSNELSKTCRGSSAAT
jgi:hypothetical protein